MGSKFVKIVTHSGAVEAPLQNFAVPRIGRLAMAGSAVVNGESRLVQVALKLKTSLPDEIFVLRIAVLGRLLANVGKQPDRLQVDVEHGVRFGQQAHRIGSRPFSQQNGCNNAAHDYHERDCNPQLVPAVSHGWRLDDTGKDGTVVNLLDIR